MGYEGSRTVLFEPEGRLKVCDHQLDFVFVFRKRHNDSKIGKDGDRKIKIEKIKVMENVFS